MKPLLAHIYEPHRVTYPCYVQPKLNGIRALYQGGRFQSRDQLPFPPGLLDHLARPLLDAFDPSVILDGELYVHGWPLQRINAAVTPVRQHPTEDTLKVEYHVFDVVDFGKSFLERCAPQIWDRCLDSCLKVSPVGTHKANNEREANDYYAAFVSRGYEGMMYRLGNCPYTLPKQEVWKHKLHGFPISTFGATRVGGKANTKFLSDKNNRVWHLLKRKDWQDDEFICVGVQEGEGKYTGMLGALVCHVPDKAKTQFDLAGYTFNVGSGLTDADRAHYWANPPIGRLIKVKYLCLSSDGIPLNPTILAIL